MDLEVLFTKNTTIIVQLFAREIQKKFFQIVYSIFQKSQITLNHFGETITDGGLISRKGIGYF